MRRRAPGRSSMLLTRVRRHRAFFIGCGATPGMCGPVAPADADDPSSVGATAALPAVGWHHSPATSGGCIAGITRRERAIRQMVKRLDSVAATRVPSAAFALAYPPSWLEYLETKARSGFDEGSRLRNHEDAACAASAAWRIVLNDGGRRHVSGMDDLLGSDPHPNRDSLFVLAEIGLVAPGGRSRDPDDETINVMLNRALTRVAEEGARARRAVACAPTPYGVGATVVMQALVPWREFVRRRASHWSLRRSTLSRPRCGCHRGQRRGRCGGGCGHLKMCPIT
jgi:hypothetical protein